MKIAYRNVLVNWRHSLAAILSIVAAFFSLVLFEGYMKDVAGIYYDGYRNRAMYGDFIVEDRRLTTPQAKSEPWNFFLDEDVQNELSQFFETHRDLIKAKVRFLNLQGMITNGKTSSVFVGFGHDLEQGEVMRERWAWNTMYGVPLVKAKEVNPLVLGRTLGRVLGCEPHKIVRTLGPDGVIVASERPFDCLRLDLQLSLVTPSGQLNALDMNVVGLIDGGYQEVDGKLVGMGLSDAQTLMNTKKISFATFKLKDSQKSEFVVQDFNRVFNKKYPQVRIVRWQDHVAGEMYTKTMNLLSVFRNFVIIVILSISILSVMNTMVKIVKERTREVGTLLSLGFQKWQVSTIFVLEAVLLGLLGSAIGATSSLIASLTLNRLEIFYKAGMLSEPVLFRIGIAPLDYFRVVIMLVVVTALTAALSVRGTLSRKIVENLQHS